MSDLVQLTAAPVIDPGSARLDMAVPAGSTIDAMITLGLPALATVDRKHLRVTLVSAESMMPVAREYWRHVRPKPGVRVVIRVVPGKNAVRSILMVVVSIAAFALAPAIAGAFGFSAGTAGFGLVKGLISAGLTAIASLAINALIPPPKTNDGEKRDTFQVSGWRNRVPTDSDPVPMLFGAHRVAPVFAATTYTEIVGDEQYVRGLFAFGYGPLSLSDIRIGETSIAEYDEVEIETRAGYAGDEPVTLYPHQVIEEATGIELVRPLPRDDAGEVIDGEPAEEKPVTRATALDSASASVIIAMPSGLFDVDDGGNVRQRTVSVRIRQRPVGSPDWQDVATLDITAAKRETFFRQHSWDFPARGKYEIEVTRMTDEQTSTRVSDRVTLAAIQSIRPEYPINFGKPLCLLAMRIKATYQLNGALDNVNALASRIAEPGELANVSNPAAAFVKALTGPCNPYPVPIASIDMDAITDWYEWCQSKGLKYDRLHDAPENLGEMLLAICAAGRATPRHDGVRWTVVIDRPDDLVIDHISPRNASDFQWSRTYFDPPHAFRVRFFDATNDFKPAERIVPWPGHAGPIDLTEQIEMPGKTDPAEIWREARRRQYELIYRPDSYRAMQSGAARVATRGDLVALSSDVLTRTQVAARVRAVQGALVALDEIVTMEAGKEYGIRFRHFADANDKVGVSLVRKVSTRDGRWKTLMLDDASTMPLVGDLIHFGELDTVSHLVKVKGIEPGQDFAATIHMIDAAPVIDELTDAEMPPAWDGRVGGEIANYEVAPVAPRIASVVSGLSGTDSEDGLAILIAPGGGSAATLSSYRIEHRLSGGAWSSITVPVANGGASIGGYVKGQAVDIRVYAIGGGGTEGPASGTVTVTIGANDPVLPGALNAASITAAGGLGFARVSLVTTADEATAALQLYRVPSGGMLDRDVHRTGAQVAVVPSSSVNLVDGDTTRVSLVNNGAFAGSDAWTSEGGWTIAGGKAAHTAGTADLISQAITLTAGKYYRMAFAVSGRSAGSVTPQLTGGTPGPGTARSANGYHLDRIQAGSGNDAMALAASTAFDGSIDDVVLFEESGASIPQGDYDYYIEPLNSDGAAGPVSGPFSVTIV